MSRKSATTMVCVAATLGFSGLAHGQAAWCGRPLFPGQQFLVQGPATYVAAGDLDGDGHQDLVALAGSDVVVLVGQGDGTFTDGPSYELSTSPRWVAIDDLDGDGALDLAVVGYSNPPRYHGTVSILLGNGDGTFAGPVVYQTGIQSLAVAISDLDGDGNGDLAVANPGTYPDLDGTVSVLLGSGDGTFADAVTYPAGQASAAVAIGDLDGDGDSDLVVGNYFGQDVTILLGNGDGTFTGGASLSYPTGNFPISISVDDLDGDGDCDLAIAGGNLSILLGNGDGTFAAPIFLDTDQTSFVLAEDLDNDGDTDLAVPSNGCGHGCDDDSIQVLVNQGGGKFAPAVRYVVGDEPRALAAADLNNDGALDLAVANGDYQRGGITIAVGNGDATFAAARVLEAPDDAGLSLLADLDNDGDTDLVLDGGPSVAIYVVLANGDGSFAEPVDYGMGLNVSPVAIGDMNGNGYLDIVAIQGGPFGAVFVFLGNGDGTYQPPLEVFGGGYMRRAVVSDFNGDGHADLAVTRFELDQVGIMLGYGDGTFSLLVDYVVGDAPLGIAADDLDGDGDADLAVTNYLSGNVSVLLGNGDGTFAPAVYYSTNLSFRPRWVALGDLDRDGDLDLAVANYDSSHGRVTILLNNGDGTFASAVHYASPRGPSHVAVADLDADGISDLAVANSTGENVGVLRGRGDGTFLPALMYAVAGGPGLVGVADFDGDGDQDLAAGSTLGISLLFNNSCPRGDLNGDCVVDALDLGNLLPCFGQPADSSCDSADINNDGTVNVLDLIDLLLAFGTTCP